MSTTKDPATEDQNSALAEWFTKQPLWIQHAATAILDGEAVGPDEIAAFAKSAMAEARGQLSAPGHPIQLSSLALSGGGSVALQSIGEISGIGQLNPRTPLNFGSDNLAVVFGSNGAGKSSYVRILKNACGARLKGEIHGNVFHKDQAQQQCTIGYRDAEGEHSMEWMPGSGVIPELSTVDIFDTHCGHSYLASEGTPTYEPRPLVFLSEIAGVCDHVGAKLHKAIEGTPSSLPSLSPEHSGTTIGNWYKSLSAKTSQTDLDAICSWGADEDGELDKLAKYLAEGSPKDRAKEFARKKEVVDALISSLGDHCAALSNEACIALMALRKQAKEKQQTAELAAKLNLDEAKLDGVGTKQWLELWSIARTYSKEVAYPDQDFPNVDDSSHCVLCQQELTPEARSRLQSFERYVSNEAAAAAKLAKTQLKEAIDALLELPENETLTAKAESAGMDDATLIALTQFYADLSARRALLLDPEITDQFGAYPETATWMSSARTMAAGYAETAKQFLEGFSEEERTVKADRRKELLAKKWIHGQKSAIETELERLRKIAIMEKAKGLCGTRAISLKKGSLAEELITPAYIAAFNSELKRLGARRVQATLVRTRVDRGAVLHQVRLSDAVHNRPIQEILSEGEHRIVCIAAFLADVATKPNGSTFVFDDPISSLDLDFEEAVVRRLVELSSTRQVIIFTHRLSLLGMVQDYAKKAGAGVQLSHIRKEPWGAGQPGDETIETAKPKAVLNAHLPNRIKEANDILETEGQAAYQVHAQSICTETRKLVERMIEVELLGDVIQRHRRAINTLGKLERLTDITSDDCVLIEDMMTKYSRYEHAQSAEAPVELPDPDELLEDVAKLKAWRDGVEARRK